MQHSACRSTILAAAIAGTLAASEAGAQSASELPEVVVTARQRAELIEDVPATVQAFTDAQIVSAGIERPQDFIALTPNVSQVQTAEAGDMQVVIRGINTGRDAETNFALVVDGVLQTNPNALNQELNGVTQIEVLKGPQGAVYGRNALAGAIILTTRKPGDEPEFEVGAGYGSDNSYKGDLYLSGPLGDTLRGQPLALHAQHRRAVEQHAARLRRLRRLLRGVRRHRAADVRRRRRQLRRQGEGLDGRVGRHQLQRGGLVLRGGDDLRRPAVRRGPERPRLLLHQQHHPAERAGQPELLDQGRLGRRRRHAHQRAGLQRPDQLLPDRRRERRVLPVRADALVLGIVRGAHSPTRRCRRRSTTATRRAPSSASRPTPRRSSRPTARRPAAATSTSSATRRT